ncbi:MAG: hypothetical protein ACRCZI_12875 [Cetobacterium sp.]
MKNLIIPSTKEQNNALMKNIFDLKKNQDIDDTIIIKRLTKICDDVYKILFDKTDIKYILTLTGPEIDKIIDDKYLNISKNFHKKIVTYDDFITYFAIPDIIEKKD